MDVRHFNFPGLNALTLHQTSQKETAFSREAPDPLWTSDISQDISPDILKHLHSFITQAGSSFSLLGAFKKFWHQEHV